MLSLRYPFFIPIKESIFENNQFNSYEQVIAKLKQSHDPVRSLHTLTVEGKVAPDDFRGLLEWINEYHERQKAYDSFD